MLCGIHRQGVQIAEQQRPAKSDMNATTPSLGMLQLHARWKSMCRPSEGKRCMLLSNVPAFCALQRQLME